jgi:hypothetical protein
VLPLGHAMDHQESTVRRRASILAEIHPELRLGQATTGLPGVLRINGLHSNHSQAKRLANPLPMSLPEPS